MILGLKIVYVFLLHFIADWVLQSKEMSRGKSTRFKILFQHASIHLVVFFLGMMLITDPVNAGIFAISNALIHGCIDWYLWRIYKVSVYFRKAMLIPKEKYDEWKINPKKMEFRDVIAMIRSYDFNNDTQETLYLKKEFKYWDDFWFGFMLGLDQWLHAATLGILFGLLFT